MCFPVRLAVPEPLAETSVHFVSGGRSVGQDSDDWGFRIECVLDQRQDRQPLTGGPQRDI